MANVMVNANIMIRVSKCQTAALERAVFPSHLCTLTANAVNHCLRKRSHVDFCPVGANNAATNVNFLSCTVSVCHQESPQSTVMSIPTVVNSVKDSMYIQ